MCMRGPADALLVLPSHTGPRQREFEAIMHNWQLLQAHRPRARPGGAGAGTRAPRAADGEEGPASTRAVESREGSGGAQATARAAEGEGEAKERPPSTNAVESREGSGSAQATVRAAEGEGEAGRGEGSAASGATGNDMAETMAAWLRSREVADALSADPSQGVAVQFFNAGETDGYPGVPSNRPARLWKGRALTSHLRSPCPSMAARDCTCRGVKRAKSLAISRSRSWHLHLLLHQQRSSQDMMRRHTEEW